MFSILIANYNNGHYFKDCYESIIEQTYGDWEAIIVDDCSTDNSVELIKKIIKEDDRFKLYQNKKNRGCGYTKRKCAELAKGEILGFLDPDDSLVPEALEEMVNLHKSKPDVAIITSKYELVDEEMEYLRECDHGEPIPEDRSYLTFERGAMTHFATFKRRFYEQTDGIDAGMKRAVDQDLYFRLEERGASIFLDKVLYRYRIHSGGISQRKNLYKAQYWHFLAKMKAYGRRRSQDGQDNFSCEEVRQMKSVYFLQRFERSKLNRNFLSQFYFLVKSLKVAPSHKFKYKVKSLINLIRLRHG